MDGIKTYSLRNNQVEEDVMEENEKDPVSEATNLEGVNAREEKTVVNEATMDFTKADCLQLQSQMNGQFVFLNEQLKAQMLHINKILELINKYISSSYQKLEEFTHKNITEINGTQIIMRERGLQKSKETNNSLIKIMLVKLLIRSWKIELRSWKGE